MLLLAVTAAHAKKPKAEPDPLAVAASLLGEALESKEAWNELVELCDDIGHRVTGSPELEQAVQWGADKMRADGLDVTLEEVTVPIWSRGHERARVNKPRPIDLNVLTLGRSPGTPEGGLTAEVVVLDDFEALGPDVKGKIVLWDVPFTSYGETVRFRTQGPVRAAEHGAVASLVRSVGPHSLDTPHTGATSSEATIPAAALTIESSSQMRRWQERGIPIDVTLDLGAETQEEGLSHNVVGEVEGRDKTLKNEIVVLGCHLDAWDVGQGAQDDGAGCVMVMEAGRLLAKARPKRTVRVVLYTNEESGLAGGKAYAEAHANETIVAAMEADTGAGKPFGFRVDGPGNDEAADAAALEWVTPFAELLAPIGAGQVKKGGSGADVGPLVKQGAVGLGLWMDTTGYWPIHHTKADTIDKIDPANLAHDVAAVTVMAWMLAEMPR